MGHPRHHRSHRALCGWPPGTRETECRFGDALGSAAIQRQRILYRSHAQHRAHPPLASHGSAKPSMKITDIRFGMLRVPLKTPFKTALRTVEAVEDIIVMINTDSGHVGY